MAEATIRAGSEIVGVGVIKQPRPDCAKGIADPKKSGSLSTLRCTKSDIYLFCPSIEEAVQVS
jgi:hypothetical protein